MLALSGAEASVQACADRFRHASDVDVSVTVGRFGVDVRVGRAGGLRFQRCVNAVVRNAVAFAGGRRMTMTVGYTYELDREIYEDDGFAQPPPAPNPPCCKQ